MIGCDVRNVDDDILALLKNPDLIAINQDPGVRPIVPVNMFNEERYPAYAKHLENVRGMRAIADREAVSLEYGKRKEQMAADRALRELDELDDDDDDDSSEKKKRKRRRRNEPKKDDVVLDEAKSIMMDILRLTGGEELPNPRGDWF